jgi:hypothetical protein
MEIESGQDDGERGRAGDIAAEEGPADKANTGADRSLTEDVPIDNRPECILYLRSQGH